jgi:uncharacterized membrane protein YkvA (DUF1232 family)
MKDAAQEQKIEIELNPRELRLYDRLRAGVVERRPAVGSGVRDLLLLLPDLTVLLIRLTRDPRVPVPAKVIAGLSVAYVFSPIDLIPEALLGPFGLIDDLFVVGVALAKLLQSVHPDVVRQHWSGHGDVLDAIQRISAWSEGRVLGGLKGLVGRILGPAR